MDEYPSEVQELLQLAKDAHDPPDPDARARVRQRVAIAVAGGAAAAVAGKAIAQGGAKAGLFSSLAAKVTAASVAVVTAGTIAATELRSADGGRKAPRASTAQPRVDVEMRAEPQARLAPTPEPSKAVPAPPLAHEEAAPGPAVAEAAQAPSVGRKAHESKAKPVHHEKPQTQETRRELKAEVAPASSTDSLRGEMTLLQECSDALSSGDTSRALSLLDRYRAQFEQPLLRAEHDGLRLIARCQRGEERARLEAKRLLERSSTHVLSARIKIACKLEESK